MNISRSINISRSLLLTGLTAAAALTLAAARPAQAQIVKPGDTFSFDIAGFNTTSGIGYLLTPDLTATFGATTTFAGVGINGQDISITSAETISGLTATDTFTVSTPTNFLTTSNVSGTKITALQFDLGDANSGSNTVDLLSPTNPATATISGSILYGSANTSFALTPSTTFSNGNASYAAVEGVSTGTTAINGLAVHNFTYSLSHTVAPVPEASTTVSLGLLLALGLGVLMIAARRKTTSGKAAA